MEHRKGALGRHIRKASAEVDTWPAWLQPTHLKSADTLRISTSRAGKDQVRRADGKPNR